MICTCGSDFKTIKTGVFVLRREAIYAADLKECPECSKQVLGGLSYSPLAVGNDVDELLARLDAKGGVVYGHPSIAEANI